MYGCWQVSENLRQLGGAQFARSTRAGDHVRQSHRTGVYRSPGARAARPHVPLGDSPRVPTATPKTLTRPRVGAIRKVRSSKLIRKMISLAT